MSTDQRTISKAQRAGDECTSLAETWRSGNAGTTQVRKAVSQKHTQKNSFSSTWNFRSCGGHSVAFALPRCQSAPAYFHVVSELARYPTQQRHAYAMVVRESGGKKGALVTTSSRPHLRLGGQRLDHEKIVTCERDAVVRWRAAPGDVQHVWHMTSPTGYVSVVDHKLVMRPVVDKWVGGAHDRVDPTRNHVARGRAACSLCGRPRGVRLQSRSASRVHAGPRL